MANGLDGWGYVGRGAYGKEIYWAGWRGGYSRFVSLGGREFDVICFLIFPISAACSCPSLPGWW